MLYTHMRPIASLILILCLCLWQGCSTSAQRSPSAASRWIQANGRLIDDPKCDRLSHACLPVLETVGCSGIDVRMLDSPTVGAYAWPDGAVYVTRGLYEVASDAELAAAVAHEIGHLLDDGHVRTSVALSGGHNDAQDSEVRADALGARLLEQCGIAPSAMLSLLKKLRAAPCTSESCRKHIDARIRAIETAINVLPTGRCPGVACNRRAFGIS